MFSILAITLFICSSKVYAQSPSKIAVSKDKVWHIEFGKSVQVTDSVAKSVQVTDSKGEPINVTVLQGNYSNIANVNPPQGGYIIGESYTLKINKGITAKDSSSFSELEPINFTIVPDGGNTSGNLANAGVICEKDSWIYFLNSSDNEKLYKINVDDSGMAKISDDSPLFINIEGDWIYYSNNNDENKLYKVKTDGTERSKLSDDIALNIYAANNVVYYSNNADNMSLYKINTDGTNKIKLSEDSANLINVVGDTIYYLNVSDNRKLYKVNTDGTERAKLLDDEVNTYNISEGWIYYSNMSDNYTLYKIRLDGKNKMKLNDTPSGFINTVKNNVFYADYTKDNVLTKRSIYNSEKEEKSYTANNLAFINSANDRIYFEDLKEDKIMKMDAEQYGWHILGRKVKDIPDIDEKVYQSHSYAIPTTIKVTFSDGTEGNLPIRWDSSSYISIDYYADTSKPGKYTLTGNVEGYDKKVYLNITVLGVISADNIFKSIYVGDRFSLPGSVTATMEDYIPSYAAIAWSKTIGEPPVEKPGEDIFGQIDTSKPIEYTFEGTIPYYDKKIYYTVNIVTKDNSIPSYNIIGKYEGWIYYSNKDDFGNIYRIKEDGISNKKLLESYSGHVSLLNDGLYYVGDNFSLWKMSLDGSSTTKLSSGSVNTFTTAGNTIYYSGENGIYKINSDGSGKTQLVGNIKPVQYDYIFVYNDYVYYLPTYDWQIYRVKTDGTDLKRLTDPSKGYIFSMVLKDGYICYNNSGINKINLSDLSGTVLLSNASITTYGVEDGFVYYSKSSGVSQQIWKLSIDGKTNIPITPESESYSFIRVDNGWIYAENILDNGFTYKMKTDGSSKQLNYRF